jgi:peptidoglycan/LPS O-acetylase OafA/YrhL
MTGSVALYYGLGRPVWIEFLALAACTLIASLSWRYIEHPTLALKKWFPYHAQREVEHVEPTTGFIPLAHGQHP